MCKVRKFSGVYFLEVTTSKGKYIHQQTFSDKAQAQELAKKVNDRKSIKARYWHSVTK